MIPNMFYQLPQEILTTIYSFDNTYHHLMKKCISHIRLCGARRIRIRRELYRLRMEPETTLLSLPNAIRNQEILFRGKIYRLQIPIDYPFEPPIVFFNNKRFREFDKWSPAAGLFTVLLTCDVEDNIGCDVGLCPRVLSV